jgi:hypothetical protein
MEERPPRPKTRGVLAAGLWPLKRERTNRDVGARCWGIGGIGLWGRGLAGCGSYFVSSSKLT